MLPDRVSNPGPLTYESGALPTALRGPAQKLMIKRALVNLAKKCKITAVSRVKLTDQHSLYEAQG